MALQLLLKRKKLGNELNKEEQSTQISARQRVEGKKSAKCPLANTHDELHKGKEGKQQHFPFYSIIIPSPLCPVNTADDYDDDGGDDGYPGARIDNNSSSSRWTLTRTLLLLLLLLERH